MTENILNLLQNFHGIDPLRELFLVELNYERDNTPIGELPAGSAELVAETPLSFATGGNNNDFHVIYTKLDSKKLRKTDERQIISHLQTRFPDSLYVFSNTDQDHWHFVNVKLTREQQEETEQQREEKLKLRNVFRRITIGPNERLRTAAERIAMLDIEQIGEPDGLFDAQDIRTSLDIRTAHEEAFNVEAVTEAFFEEFKRIFKRLQTELENQTGETKWAHDYALQFLSRCLFLYFIQRKGWIGEDTDFLHTFWQTYQSSSQPTDTFVDKWLNILFFEAFNNRFHGGLRYFPDGIRRTLQFAPYLNGGLFRENELDEEYELSANISDKLWEQIFNFLEQYNFTIAEDTPLDQEVAVDPEMIGKVYESLVSAEDEERGDAGIFYTPRVEIDLMCRLALVDNLANHIGTQEDKHRFYEALFAFEPEEKAEADAKLTDLWQDIYDHITEITVVDPACGSGSFLVGMLHVLDDVRERAENHLGINTESRFERRKEIIGKNLYGVDVKQWACKVAELRLWLALIIDAEFPREELQVRLKPLLPDFSFNIRHGDSIVQDIGGMNLAQTRAIGSGVSSELKRKITDHQNEKIKYYNNDPNRRYEEKEDVENADNTLFREVLEDFDVRISNNIRIKRASLEDQPEQLQLLETFSSEPQQVNPEIVKMQKEIERLEENHAQIQRAQQALSADTTPPFVWDIAFVEIFNQRDGFDIVIENPPYIGQQKIKDPNIPRSKATKTNKQIYKAKLARTVYHAFPQFFGYQSLKDIVQYEIDAQSDFYIYFYFHGLSLLNPRGTFCAVTSNSWLDATYGKNLKEFLLKQCRNKLVLDNSVKRSFKGVDVNTVICLTSAPVKEIESSLQHIMRFVNFTVPFEAILNPVIFYEIETATKNTTTPEHCIRPMLQEVILTNDLDKKGVYKGEKWGAKYLRAPEIYLYILKKRKDILIPLEDVATIRRGFRTGDDNFFAPNRNTISYWNIEEEYLRPIVASSEDVKSLIISPEQLPRQVFLCSKAKDLLNGTSALAYIRMGEEQGIDQKLTCKRRSKWYNLGERPSPSFCFPLLISSTSTTAKTLYSPEGCYGTGSFIEIDADTDLSLPLCFSLNSTFFQLIVNVNGRLNRTWALEIQPNDLKKLLCVNPQLIMEYSLNQNSSELSPPPPPRKIGSNNSGIRRLGCLKSLPCAA